MSETRHPSLADRAAPVRAKREGWRLVQRAPQPETPDAPRGPGARKGMLIALGAGAAFWGAVAAAIWLAN